MSAFKSISEGFQTLYVELRNDLVRDGLQDSKIADGMQHLQKVLDYNVPGGKCNRGVMVAGSLKYLLPGREMNQEEEKKAIILGWCVEWLQAFFLVADDIMDQSSMRRGQPCWYLNKGIGLIAINDSFWIESTIYKILKKYFRNDPYYINVVELFHETTYQTEIGQTLDLLTSSDVVDFSRFTLERYKAIVQYKTAYYSFYLPVALAMYMGGICDEGSHAVAKSILLEMGEYFQVQDDFLDCYGEPAVIGKVGTDIEENKCSWLIVQALPRINEEQREILKANYGCKDPACAQRVKEVYKQLNMEKVFRDYEEESYQKLMKQIESASSSLPSGMFVDFANRIYKRKY
eukprot:Em0017g565a